jgi:hypothetical protein
LFHVERRHSCRRCCAKDAGKNAGAPLDRRGKPVRRVATRDRRPFFRRSTPTPPFRPFFCGRVRWIPVEIPLRKLREKSLSPVCAKSAEKARKICGIGCGNPVGNRWIYGGFVAEKHLSACEGKSLTCE